MNIIGTSILARFCSNTLKPFHEWPPMSEEQNIIIKPPSCSKFSSMQHIIHRAYHKLTTAKYQTPRHKSHVSIIIIQSSGWILELNAQAQPSWALMAPEKTSFG